jgi:hypothetical protein
MTLNAGEEEFIDQGIMACLKQQTGPKHNKGE